MSASRTTGKTYQDKLLPPPEQGHRCVETVRFCRELFNAALPERREAWRQQRVSSNSYQQKASLPGVKEVRPEGAAITAQVLQEVVLRIERTCKAVFERVQHGQKPGSPRLKSRSRFHSLTCPQVGPQGCAQIATGFLVLSTIGRGAVRWSRPREGTPKTRTILEEPDGGYAWIAGAEGPLHPLPLTGEETGRDLGLASFATLADGARSAHPRHSRHAQAAIAQANRRWSHRTKDSTRWRKAAQLLAKNHQQVQRQRRDFHHQAALALVHQDDTLYSEHLPGATRAQNHPLAKRIDDAGWSQFCAILAWKRGRCWKASRRGQSCGYESGLRWLWSQRLERLVDALACMPSLRGQPAPRPHQRPGHFTGRADPAGSRDMDARR